MIDPRLGRVAYPDAPAPGRPGSPPTTAGPPSLIGGGGYDRSADIDAGASRSCPPRAAEDLAPHC